MRKCKICGESEAVWALQYVASATPSLVRLGHHYRGFGVMPVCDRCGREEIKRVAEGKERRVTR